MSGSAQATLALTRHSTGDTRAADELLPVVYDELRALARRYMRQEGGYNTLQPTALVHEAYLRLIRINQMDWNGKTHFYAMAATQMRRVLIERARAAKAKKRGAGGIRLTLAEMDTAVPAPTLDLLSLDMALDELENRSARQAKVAELRLFAGMNHLETAHALKVSERTVRTDWRVARAWLARELDPGRDV